MLKYIRTRRNCCEGALGSGKHKSHNAIDHHQSDDNPRQVLRRSTSTIVQYIETQSNITYVVDQRRYTISGKQRRTIVPERHYYSRRLHVTLYQHLETAEDTSGSSAPPSWELSTNDANCGQLGREYTNMSFEGQFDSYSIESPVEILRDVWDGLWNMFMR